LYLRNGRFTLKHCIRNYL